MPCSYFPNMSSHFVPLWYMFVPFSTYGENLYLYCYLKKKLFMYLILFLAALGLHCCLWAFSSCREWGLCLIVLHCFSLWWLLFRGALAQYLWHMGLDCSGHEESSQNRDWTHVPALAGGFLTTGPPGKSLSIAILIKSHSHQNTS